jgi:hypothetical protein
MNVEEYHSIILNIEFKDPENTNNSPRIYFMNYNEGYSSENPHLTMKFNGVQLNGYISGTDITVSLDKLQVAEWWIERFEIPLEHAGTDLTNISSFLFESGYHTGVGVGN